LLVTLADERLMRSAHDCSDGGLAVTVAESSFETAGIGAEISIGAERVARDARVNIAASLFGESASRVVMSAVPADVTRILERASAAGVPARVIGQTGGNRIRMAVAGEIVVDVSVDEAERAWSTAIDRYFAKRVA
jgi:phosphoribosylformylglycinamidine synthase